MEMLDLLLFKAHCLCWKAVKVFLNVKRCHFKFERRRNFLMDEVHDKAVEGVWKVLMKE